jgi:two-component system, chemotaxis family, sensor kinase CheA
VDQTRQDFFIEINELMEQLANHVDELRRTEPDTTLRRKLLADMFRKAHSIKGSAATIGMSQTSAAAHELENLLAAVTAGKAAFDNGALEKMENAARFLSSSLSNPAITVGQALLTEEPIATRDETSLDDVFDLLPKEIHESLNDQQKHHVAETIAEGKELFVVSTTFDLADFDQQLRRLREQLEETGEVISTHPAVDSTQPDRINFSLLIAIPPRTKLETLGVEGVTVSAVVARENVVGSDSQTVPLAVRVELNELGSLRNAIRELSRATRESIALALQTVANEQAKTSLHRYAAQIDELSAAIEEKIESMRRVAAGSVLKRAERAGRAAARLTSKDVMFEVRGAELLIDKFVAETVASPLVHLVRNAVDHGIESSADRARLGKNARGVVRIEARNENEALTISVADDGRGIDPEVVAVQAVKAGLIDHETSVDLEESIRLIFQPGFSTAGRVSTTSGRGIGLDVVETAVKQLGAQITVHSEVGIGTTVVISV